VRPQLPLLPRLLQFRCLPQRLCLLPRLLFRCPPQHPCLPQGPRPVLFWCLLLRCLLRLPLLRLLQGLRPLLFLCLLPFPYVRQLLCLLPFRWLPRLPCRLPLLGPLPPDADYCRAAALSASGRVWLPAGTPARPPAAAEPWLR
jgi:hypothetical protein